MNNMNNMNNIDVSYYLDAIDIIYWINMDRSTERKSNMENLLKGINIPQKRIQATDALSLSDEDLYSRYINLSKFNRTKIEYAVLHSHLKTIDEFSKLPNTYNNALILEDDLTLEYSPFWNRKISDIIKNAPKNWDIIMLNYGSKYQLLDLYTYNHEGKISSCLAYIINKKASVKLMNLVKNNSKYILYDGFTHNADDYIYSLLNVYAYRYPYFTYPDNNTSTIHPNHLLLHKYTKGIAERNWRELYNQSSLNDIVYMDMGIISNISFIIIIVIFVYLFIKKYI